MQSQEYKDLPIFNPEEETISLDLVETNEKAEAGIEDTEPPLDEEDFVENALTVEKANQIIGDTPNIGSGGLEEKDLTD